MNNDPIINLLKEWKQRGIIATPEDIAKQIRQIIEEAVDKYINENMDSFEKANHREGIIKALKEG